MVGSKVKPLFNCYSGLARQDPSLTSRDSICTSRKMGSGNYCKFFSAIQDSDQKLSLFSRVIPMWRDKTSSSTSRDSIGTSRKTGSRNYYKTLSSIQRSNQNLSSFSAFIPVLNDKTSSSTSRDSIGTSRKMTSEIYCKYLSEIQRSDQKLRLFSRVIPVWRDKTFSSRSRDSINENGLRKQLYLLERNPTVRSKVMAFFSCYSCLAWQDLLFNE
jgi:hypothetical protein